MPVEYYYGVLAVLGFTVLPLAIELFVLVRDKSREAIFVRWCMSLGFFSIFGTAVYLIKEVLMITLSGRCSLQEEPIDLPCFEWVYEYLNGEYIWLSILAIAFGLVLYVLFLLKVGRFVMIERDEKSSA